MLNKRPYTNNIAVFDMFTVILPIIKTVYLNEQDFIIRMIYRDCY